MPVQLANQEHVELLKPYFAENVHYHWQQSIALFQSIPGLVGFWPMSSVQRSTGNVYDLSGEGRTLTYNGNPTYNIYNDTVPYIDLDGTGDYLSLADDTDLDILGTETINATAVRGLTIGGWFWFDTLPAAGEYVCVIGKWTPYALICTNPNFVYFDIYSGTDYPAFSTVATGAWYFIVGIWIPSTSVVIFNNGVFATNSTSIPASIANTANTFNIGNPIATAYLDGRAALCFLSHQALSNAFISLLYNTSRGAFGL